MAPAATAAAAAAAGQEAKTLVLCKQNDRFPKKCLFSLSKASFLRLEGLLKAPSGDSSEDWRTEGAQVPKLEPPGVKKYSFTEGIQGFLRKCRITPVEYK